MRASRMSKWTQLRRGMDKQQELESFPLWIRQHLRNQRTRFQAQCDELMPDKVPDSGTWSMPDKRPSVKCSITRNLARIALTYDHSLLLMLTVGHGLTGYRVGVGYPVNTSIGWHSNSWESADWDEDDAMHAACADFALRVPAALITAHVSSHHVSETPF